MITDRADLRNMPASTFTCYKLILTPIIERTIIGLWISAARIGADAGR